MILTIALPGLLSTILNLPAISTTTATTSATASLTVTPTPTITDSSSTITPTPMSACTLLTTTFPSTLLGVSIALPTGPEYYYKCGTSIVPIDLAVSGTNTLTYPAYSDSTSLLAGYTKINADNGQAVVTSSSSVTSRTTMSVGSGSTSTVQGSGSATVSAPSTTASHSGARAMYALPRSTVGLVLVVW